MTAGLLFRRFAAYLISNFRKIDVTKNAVSGLIWAISGFYIGQIFGIKMINDKADFIILRLKYEKEINYIRNKEEGIHQEYPFINKELHLKGDDEVRLMKYSKFKKLSKGI